MQSYNLLEVKYKFSPKNFFASKKTWKKRRKNEKKIRRI